MIRNRLRSVRDAGFTLVELLIVVVIIGVLVGIAIPVYLHFQEGAYDDSAQSDLRTLRLEERNYAGSNGAFGYASDLNAANKNIVMSAGTLGVVIFADANSFCVATINSKGSTDPNSVAKLIGMQNKVYFYDSATAKNTSSGWGCSQTTDTSKINSYFDSAGYH